MAMGWEFNWMLNLLTYLSSIGTLPPMSLRK